MGSSSQDHAPTAGAAQGTSSLAPRETHTPGPWRLTSDAGHPTNARITSTARRHIAKVYAEDMGPDPVCEANARLIAAAPDMLDGLAGLCAAVEGPDEVGGPNWTERVRHNLKIARAAIRKALSDGSEARTGGEDA